MLAAAIGLRCSGRPTLCSRFQARSLSLLPNFALDCPWPPLLCASCPVSRFFGYQPAASFWLSNPSTRLNSLGCSFYPWGISNLKSQHLPSCLKLTRFVVSAFWFYSNERVWLRSSFSKFSRFPAPPQLMAYFSVYWPLCACFSLLLLSKAVA